MCFITNGSRISFSSRNAPSIARAVRSSPPPGLPAGTISIGFEGYSAACSAKLAQATTDAINRRAAFMGLPPLVLWLNFARHRARVPEARDVDRVRARAARDH